MARIRSIKPEFCTSAQVAECSRNARLLFVLMWIHCDDNGVHPASAKQLRMECFPGDDDMTAAAVQELVEELKAQSLLTEYENAGARYWLVTGWKHQRIDKPQPGKYPLPTDADSAPVTDALPNHSKNAPVALPPDRNGRDRKGSERKGEEGKGMVPAADAPATTSEIWSAYRAAYFHRYGAEPVRNATVNGQLAQVVKRLGAEEAPDVAAFYVSHNGGFYASRMHPVALLLNDCEKLRTEWATGHRMTQTKARQMDKTQANGDVWQKLIAEAEEAEREG